MITILIGAAIMCMEANTNNGPLRLLGPHPGAQEVTGSIETAAVELVPATAATVGQGSDKVDLVDHVDDGEGVVDCLADAAITNVLAGIAMVESGGRDMGVHPDGVSYGRYGLTLVAVRELERCGDVSREELRMLEANPAQLAAPDRNARLAWLYLRVMYEQHACGSWIEAAGWYHGGNAERRRAYADRVRRAMK
jgi:hypothetical protein